MERREHFGKARRTAVSKTRKGCHYILCVAQKWKHKTAAPARMMVFMFCRNSFPPATQTTPHSVAKSIDSHKGILVPSIPPPRLSHASAQAAPFARVLPPQVPHRPGPQGPAVPSVPAAFARDPSTPFWGRQNDVTRTSIRRTRLGQTET